ncbi:MAG: molecular chaperone DnaJ [Pseudomonadota bacterium]|nr:molecular chaperone DnaJ [Pseudomonadota bacterium]
MLLNLALLLAGIGALAGLAWLLRTPPPVIAAHFRRALAVLVVLLLLFLAVTGRLHWLLVLIGALVAAAVRLLPLLHYAPLVQRLWRQVRPQSARPQSETSGGPTGAKRSTVESSFIRLWLDHATGEIDGEVLAGTFTGHRLSELQREHLMRLYRDCRGADPDSAALLQSYLDRIYGETWQSAPGSETGTRPGPTPMTADEARQVLGLGPGASRAEVIDAHRRLIHKLHPDRGGSDYLAAKINQARAVLLGAS